MAPLQRPRAVLHLERCLLECPVQPHMAATQAVGMTQAALLRVAAVSLGQNGLGSSGCQSCCGLPGCLLGLPGFWLVVGVALDLST